MRAVRGYEEKDPDITRQMTSGYPRFVVHPFTQQLAAHFEAAGRTLWLTSSERMAGELSRHLGAGAGATLFFRDGLHGVSHPDAAEVAARAKLYLQNVGGFLPSREAEDHLVRLGLRPAASAEARFAGDAAAEVRGRLRRVLPAAGDTDLLLANSGMNAVHAAFRAVSEVQAARGRTRWVQLGWAYLDTIAILEKFPPGADDYIAVGDVFDQAALARLFAAQGSRIAGVIAEVPNNPLMQTPDVPALAALCRRHGVHLVLDASIASVFSVDVLPFADLLVSSLTKYTASEGDVLAGLVAVNPAGPDAAALRHLVADRLEPVYPRDLQRLAEEIGQTEPVLAQIERTAARVAAFLTSHPKVKEVYWALHPASRANYRRIARAPDAIGGVLSFTVRGPLDAFYDRLNLPKGPSFGMKTTLICPYMYLAHYDLLKTPASRARLAADGLDPDLLRLCVGVEPAEDIIASLAEALK
jgi:cystathionine gamma-synthase